MNIAQALKEKNRLKNRLSVLAQTIENSQRYSSDRPTKPGDVGVLLSEYDIVTTQLSDLKKKIATATCHVADKISMLDLLKSKKGLINSLCTDDTPLYRMKRADEEIKIDMVVQISEEHKAAILEGIQKEIDHIQDELDVYNASTKV